MTEEWKGEIDGCWVVDFGMLELTKAIMALPPLTTEQLEELRQYLAKKYGVSLEGEGDE